jgi:hypothetical protein
MKFKVNMGLIDRSVRMIVGILLIYIGFINVEFVVSEVLRYILGGIGVLNIISALAGICPFYIFANISTCQKANTQ